MGAPSRFAFLGPLEQLLKPQFTPQSGSHIFGDLEPLVFVDLSPCVVFAVYPSLYPEMVSLRMGTGSVEPSQFIQDVTFDVALECAAAIVKVVTAREATTP